MIDFDRLYVRFGQFGGLRLVREYARLGLTWTIVGQFFSCLFRHKSLKNIYPVIGRVVNPMLKKRYAPVMRNAVSEYSAKCVDSDYAVQHKPEVYVWWCWLQGVESAPALAKACLCSLKRNLSDVCIVEIDENNYTDWVTLPDYILTKYKDGKIPPALFSDMLRLQLLAQYGGVWIDSTVLCSSPSPLMTGSNGSNASATFAYHPVWSQIIDAQLFVFQYTKPGAKWSGSLSNWFISSAKGNPFILVLRDMLFAYWRDYDVTLQYYIFHLFFDMVAHEFPEQILRMPYGWSNASISLGLHMSDKYDEKKWNRFTQTVQWHKLSYRVGRKTEKDKDNYYNHILKRYHT